MLQYYTGCVENRVDPLKLGRCQVRIVGLHTENKTALPTSDLPWAYPVMPITSAGTSGIGVAPIGPVEGSWVLITFMDPDQQQPIMLGTLGGAFQTDDAIQNGEIKNNTVAADGEVDLSTDKTMTPDEKTAAGGAAAGGALEPGKAKDKGEIIGPLAKLIAKGESGSAGYDAFNRGSGAKPGTGSIGGEKLKLTNMKIKDIMAQQALSPSAPDRLFAVGKYQCIPMTLREACNCLNIDTEQPFNETIQDIICQEYLVGRKRPKLIAYYRNKDKNNETLLKEAGRSLAAEFASIEDPNYIGYPYGGPEGRYAKNGNKVHTKWEQIKSTLMEEWDFRNNSSSPPPTTLIAGGDKVDKGTDYSGVAKIAPKDDSTASTPREAQSSDSGIGGDIGGLGDLGGLGDIGGLGDLASSIPGIDGVGGLQGLSELGLDSSLLGNLDTGILSSITSEISSFTELTNSLQLDNVIGDLSSFASNLGLDAAIGETLSQFGGSLNEIAGNLGIELPTGSVSELVGNLGLVNATPQSIMGELHKIAISPEGQAKSLLAKLDISGESTIKNVAPIGQKNPDGSTSNGLTIDPNIGFQDPSGVYPKYKNEPDTNRLAAGNNLGRTYVVQKEADRKTGVRIAGGGTWDQSPVPYNATYPYNKVTQTESGHVMEMDDTPGSERIHFWHKAGSFLEWDANGTQVNRIVGDGYEILERNGYVYVKGACNLTVDGALNVRTDNIFNLEVSGATKINIYNEANINISGNANFAVGGEFNLKAAKINIESEGQINFKADTGMNIMSTKDMNIKSDAGMFLEANADVNVKGTGSGVFINGENSVHLYSEGKGVNIQAGEDINLKAGANVNAEADGTANLKGGGDTNVEAGGSLSILGGDVAIDGGVIDLNNGSAGGADSAASATPALEAKKAGQADLELPIEIRGTSGVSSMPPLSVVTRGGEVGFDAPGAGDSSKYANRRVATNEVSKGDIESDKIVMQKGDGKAAPTGALLGKACDAIAAMPADQFSAGMKLSKYFTLGDLTKGGERIPRVTYNVNGANITPQEIVCNLKGLCENVLDPIREKYGKFTISSAFRRPPFGAQAGDLGAGHKEGGDHPIGCAADIVFETKQKTFDVCNDLIKSIGGWNQVIMEYNGSQYWIHVAFHYSGNKGDYFTMNSHKTYAGTYPRGGFILV